MYTKVNCYTEKLTNVIQTTGICLLGMSILVPDEETNEIDKYVLIDIHWRCDPKDTHLDPATCFTAVYSTCIYTEIFWEKLRSL